MFGILLAFNRGCLLARHVDDLRAIRGGFTGCAVANLFGDFNLCSLNRLGRSSLSDRLGLERAVMVLPVMSLIGGIVTLGAMRTVIRDMDRVKDIEVTPSFPASGATG